MNKKFSLRSFLISNHLTTNFNGLNLMSPMKLLICQNVFLWLKFQKWNCEMQWLMLMPSNIAK